MGCSGHLARLRFDYDSILKGRAGAWLGMPSARSARIGGSLRDADHRPSQCRLAGVQPNRSPARYFRAESTTAVTTLRPGPNSAARSSAVEKGRALARFDLAYKRSHELDHAPGGRESVLRVLDRVEV